MERRKDDHVYGMVMITMILLVKAVAWCPSNLPPLSPPSVSRLWKLELGSKRAELVQPLTLVETCAGFQRRHLDMVQAFMDNSCWHPIP
ncbi:hypothetical protein M758_2G181100 [Ceratodon purpureus]|nr:hypothetical protein M758_2G181100 [Ceratodon purpureus]